MPPVPGSRGNESAVTQGPDWILNLVTGAPPWLNTGLKIAALIAAAVVAYRLYQWGELPLDVQREMQVILGHITAITTATLAMVNLTALPYIVDIALGFAVGYGFVLAVQMPAIRSQLPLPVDGRERIAAGWLVLAVGPMVVPMAVRTRGLGMQLTKSRFAISALATAMLAYNASVLSSGKDEQTTQID